MKKILFVNDVVFGGGVEKIMYDIVSELDENSYDITILALEKEKNFYKQYSKNIKHKFFYPLAFLQKHRKLFLVRIMRKGLRVLTTMRLKNKHFDVAVAIKEGSIMKTVAGMQNVTKKIAWIQTDYNSFHWTKKFFADNKNELECMKQFNNVVCVSEAAKEGIINTVGNPGNLIVRYNPLNIEVIKKESECKCDKERQPGKVLFVAVGRLVKQKGYTQLLRIITDIKKELDFELWIIGDGEQKYKDEMKQIIKEGNLEDNVVLLGNKENPYPYVKQADWLICSSETESFCLVIQEALILGIPVVTTNCPGACELIDDKYSIVVENMEQMQKQLIEIIKDPSITHQYKRNVRDYYKPVPFEVRVSEIERLF